MMFPFLLSATYLSAAGPSERESTHRERRSAARLTLANEIESMI
jgi:hypothetical protein